MVRVHYELMLHCCDRPDGEYASPADDADVYELQSHIDMGFNFIRKHIKVAPHRWYYHTDRLGIMVFQDMPETIHGNGNGATFMAELAAMVKGRRNHPSILAWDLFNEASPSNKIVAEAAAIVNSLDNTRPIDACSGCHSQRQWWPVSNVQDFHTDTMQTTALNASKLTVFAEAHRCGCLPPPSHMWFHNQPVSQACYSVTHGVDCDAASQTYASWANAELDAVRHFGLSGTGYVQNRDMEGVSALWHVCMARHASLRHWCYSVTPRALGAQECNGLLTYDAFPKLNVTPIRAGNFMLKAAHDEMWNSGL
jgi:hypothetical protein